MSALVVPNFERLRDWAEETGYDLPDDREELVEDESVREWVSEAVEEVNEGLGHVDSVKDFAIVSEEWTAENDLRTPSMKKRRHNIIEAFSDRIEEIYADEDDQTATATH